MKIYINQNCYYEKYYVLNYVFQYIYDKKFEIEFHQKDNITIVLNKKKMVFPDLVFRQIGIEGYGKRLQTQSFKKITFTSSRGETFDLPVFFYDFKNQVPDENIGIDVFGTLFFFITNYEELYIKKKDRYGRISAKDTLLYKYGLLEIPICNVYLDFLYFLFLDNSLKLEKKVFIYDYRISHDIDLPLKFRYKKVPELILRSFYLKIKHEIGFKKSFLSQINLKRKTENDPYNTFNYIQNISIKYGKNDYYYVIVGRDFFDACHYNLNDNAILDILRYIVKNDNYLGFHPTRLAAKNFFILESEFKKFLKLKNDLNMRDSNNRNRQHFLKFDIEKTVDYLEGIGVTEDSSLGYHDLPGFRSGICYPFPLFNHKKRRQSSIMEYPLNVMDVTLLEYMNSCAQDKKMKIVMNIIDQCKKYNGVFTLLWHNSNLININQRNAYEQILHYAALH